MSSRMSWIWLSWLATSSMSARKSLAFSSVGSLSLFLDFFRSWGALVLSLESDFQYFFFPPAHDAGVHSLPLPASGIYPVLSVPESYTYSRIRIHTSYQPMYVPTYLSTYISVHTTYTYVHTYRRTYMHTYTHFTFTFLAAKSELCY